ncbi:hypothetical protein PUN28_014513 [Cardiocondyla obscurior]|uniref:Uncharacterized protein n=1 Tax=Cardiocondyla obscurior TaxID=286306 RepID=A0AAW2F477_9HYME
MVSIISRYFKFNRYIMLAIGIWPYQNSKFSQVQVITIFSIILSYIIFQIRSLMNTLQHTYDQLKNPDEIAIIEKYSNTANTYINIFTTCAVCGLFFVWIFPIWPQVVNIFLPINSSRRHLVIETEYFINPDKYFYIILLHSNVSMGVADIIVIAISAMIIKILKYTCGMFNIARYN